jgi:hypothetical protein
MKVIMNVPDEGYYDRTWWRLFQKRILRTKLDIYVLIFPTINLFLKRLDFDFYRSSCNGHLTSTSLRV